MPDEQDLSALTDEEQVALLQAAPEGGNTGNAPPEDVAQPASMDDIDPANLVESL